MKVKINIRKHFEENAELGITWRTLKMAAEHLFGHAPETDATEEA